MSGDAHVRICESLGVKFPRATRLVITIAGRKHWLWRAVDQDGYVLDEIVQSRRDTKAAKRLLVRLLKKQGMVPSSMRWRSGTSQRLRLPETDRRTNPTSTQFM